MILLIPSIMPKVSPRRIHIAPVGFEIDRVVLPAKMDKADKVFLMVHSDRKADQAKEYTAEIERRLKKAKIETEQVAADLWNIEEITRVTRDLILANSDCEIAINLASGSTNHSIGMDRACMTFRNRWNLRPFYPFAKTYNGFVYPHQQTEGVKELKTIAPHRIQIPEDELIQALKIIKQNQGKNGMKKKDLAKACDKEHLISYTGKSPNSILIALDRQILQKLEHRWKAVRVKPQGRSFVVSLTEEGEWFEYILQNPEPASNT